jgi:RNA polymerase sigma-70 factor, ECF subfamily
MDLQKADWVRQLKQGDRSVFEQIFYAYFAAIERFAREYVVHQHVANDMAQNTFLSLWEKRESLRDDTNLKNYLITLTRNQCLNHLNHAKIEKRYIQSTQEKYEREFRLNTSALERFNFDKLQSKELEETIHKAIDDLPEEARSVFLMSRVDGFTYQEIAEKHNISLKAVEKRMSKALTILRGNLKNYYFLVFFIFLKG